MIINMTTMFAEVVADGTAYAATATTRTEYLAIKAVADHWFASSRKSLQAMLEDRTLKSGATFDVDAVTFETRTHDEEWDDDE